MTASGRIRTTEDLPVSTRDNSAEVNYRVGGSGTEESADESDEWSGYETEEPASEEEDTIVWGGRGVQ